MAEYQESNYLQAAEQVCKLSVTQQLDAVLRQPAFRAVLLRDTSERRNATVEALKHTWVAMERPVLARIMLVLACSDPTS